MRQDNHDITKFTDELLSNYDHTFTPYTPDELEQMNQSLIDSFQDQTPDQPLLDISRINRND